MSLQEIFTTALVDTLLGMGTVFLVLIFISICIWLLGKACSEKPKVEAETVPEESAGITPETVAVITAAIHQLIKDESKGDDDGDQYIVRNVRRATWKHTS